MADPVADFFGKPKPTTGVFKPPHWTAFYPGFNTSGGVNMPKQPTPEPTSVIPPVIQNLRNLYAGLGQNLGNVSADQAQRIAESSSNAIRAMQTIDPLAGYRQTATTLATLLRLSCRMR